MFTADNRTENFLTTLGVSFRYTHGILLPQKFIPDWDKDNLGRPVDVREDAVLEYATLMDNGSAAPAPILLHTPLGYRVLDGVQRLSAAQLSGIERVSAYVVTTTSENLIATIRVLANARMQGRAEPAEWTRRRAVEVLVVNRQMSCDEVAKLGGWRAVDVRKIADAIVAQQRIVSIGGPELPDTMLAVLNDYCTDAVMSRAPTPVAGFLMTLKQAKLSAEDAEPYIEAFFAPVHTPNAHNVLTARLQELRADPEISARVTGRQRTRLQRDVALLRELKSAERVLDDMLANGMPIANIDEFFQIVARLRTKLDRANTRKVRRTQTPTT